MSYYVIINNKVYSSDSGKCRISDCNLQQPNTVTRRDLWQREINKEENNQLSTGKSRLFICHSGEIRRTNNNNYASIYSPLCFVLFY